MNKQKLLSLANKGKQMYEDFEFEVITHTDNDGDEMLQVKLLPVNKYSDPAFFGGGWVKYYEDKDYEQLVPAMKKAAEKMKQQAAIVNTPEVIHFLDTGKEDNHCNHLIKCADNGKVYVIQYLKDSNGKEFGFQVLTVCKWTGGYEPNFPINVNIELDGVPYIPIWSFWLDGAVYKLRGDENA